ncbi:MAG: hypothetical protein AAF806_28380 [Bacteroidota bacterium]
MDKEARIASLSLKTLIKFGRRDAAKFESTPNSLYSGMLTEQNALFYPKRSIPMSPN